MTDTFLRWLGGKRQLLPIIKKRFPKKLKNSATYYEPFVGAGAVFFALNHPKNHINDLNSILVETYKTLNSPTKVKALAKELLKPKYKNTESNYVKLRKRFNKLKKGRMSIEVVALFVYLNNTSFNGLYRENLKGEYNAYYGHRKTLDWPYAALEKLGRSSIYMRQRKVKITNNDFRTVLKLPQKGDFVYIDPPYHKPDKKSKKEMFVKYNKNMFTEQDQIDLIDMCDELNKKGCYVMYSNSNSPFIKRLFRKLPARGGRKWKISEVTASRRISVDHRTRHIAKKNEILVTNY
jgi:DNA adenine methylase